MNAWNSFYIHDIDPVLLPLVGPLAIRWYGLSYILGFVGAYLLLNRWGRQGSFPLHGEKLQSFLAAIVVGVMVGGRLGYLVFYEPAEFFSNPLMVVRLWEGGMASHGGMIGLALASWWFARRHQTGLLTLTDGLATVAPLGLGLGRLANFINGELWGRVTSVRWAVIFPQEAGLPRASEAGTELIARYAELGMLQPRHPSQLYQAFLEGAVLLTAMLLAHRTRWAATPGRLSGLFLLVYAAARVTGEFFREPEIIHGGWLTQGQLLSLVLLIPVGLYLIRRQSTPTERRP